MWVRFYIYSVNIYIFSKIWKHLNSEKQGIKFLIITLVKIQKKMSKYNIMKIEIFYKKYDRFNYIQLFLIQIPITVFNLSFRDCFRTSDKKGIFYYFLSCIRP